MANVTFYNVFVAFFAATGGFTYGFGFGVFVSSIAYPDFYDFFNLTQGSSYTTSILGAINGLFAFAAAVGALLQGYTSDKLGRRRATFLAACLCILGGALTAGSQNVPMLIVVRFIHGLGVGQIVTLAPLYIAEISPPHRRGMFVGIFTAALGAGYTSVAFVSYGTWHATNVTLQWRLPLALSTIGPIFQSIGIWFVPESPRWLIWHERKEEAWDVIRRLHHDPSDASDSKAHTEHAQICAQVEYDKQFNVSYWQIFKQPSWRKRALLAMFLLFASQSTGVLGIGNYKILVYRGLGLEEPMPILMNAIYTLIGSLVTYLGSWLSDKVGRRVLLLIGFPLSGAFLLGEALLQRQYVGGTNEAGLSACVLFLFLYIVAYDTFIEPATFIYVSEIWPTTIRSKGLALSWFAYFVGAITYTTPSALAFKNIGWRMYMVWFSCNMVSLVIVYFLVPETRRLTLEEMGDLFGDQVVVHIASDGRHLVEEEEENGGVKGGPLETPGEKAVDVDPTVSHVDREV